MGTWNNLDLMKEFRQQEDMKTQNIWNRRKERQRGIQKSDSKV